MATVKQKRAVVALVGNGGNVTAAMREANYAPATYNTPQKLTESKGYKEVLAEYGLTDKLVVEALAEDIKDKKGKRTPELALGAEILGLKKAVDKPPVQNNFFIFNGEQRERIARRALARASGGSTEPSSVPDSDQPEVRPELAP